MNRPVNDPVLKEDNESYLKRLELYYSKIDSLTRRDIEKLDKKLDVLIERIIINKKQNQELSALRDWLLPMLMNGQVKVG